MGDDVKVKVCGIVMPIAGMDDCPETHWAEVKQIIISVVEELDYECKLVSEETDVGVIHKRIVQNLYENDLIICDVSCRNANVMFELGMRLAFDKPVILIKDDKTPYSFDTSPVEHLTYRRDLRFSSINDFKSKLAEKIAAVMKSENISSFLSSFGTFKTVDLKRENVEPYEFVLEELASIRKMISHSRQFSPPPRGNWISEFRGRADLIVHTMQLAPRKNAISIKCSGPSGAIKIFISALELMVGVGKVSHQNIDKDITSLHLNIEDGADGTILFDTLVELIKPNKAIPYFEISEKK